MYTPHPHMSGKLENKSLTGLWSHLFIGGIKRDFIPFNSSRIWDMEDYLQTMNTLHNTLPFVIHMQSVS